MFLGAVAGIAGLCNGQRRGLVACAAAHLGDVIGAMACCGQFRCGSCAEWMMAVLLAVVVPSQDIAWTLRTDCSSQRTRVVAAASSLGYRGAMLGDRAGGFVLGVASAGRWNPGRRLMLAWCRSPGRRPRLAPIVHRDEPAPGVVGPAKEFLRARRQPALLILLLVLLYVA